MQSQYVDPLTAQRHHGESRPAQVQTLPGEPGPIQTGVQDAAGGPLMAAINESSMTAEEIEIILLAITTLGILYDIAQ